MKTEVFSYLHDEEFQQEYRVRDIHADSEFFVFPVCAQNIRMSILLRGSE